MDPAWPQHLMLLDMYTLLPYPIVYPKSRGFESWQKIMHWSTNKKIQNKIAAKLHKIPDSVILVFFEVTNRLPQAEKYPNRTFEI